MPGEKKPYTSTRKPTAADKQKIIDRGGPRTRGEAKALGVDAIVTGKGSRKAPMGLKKTGSSPRRGTLGHDFGSAMKKKY